MRSWFRLDIFQINLHKLPLVAVFKPPFLWHIDYSNQIAKLTCTWDKQLKTFEDLKCCSALMTGIEKINMRLQLHVANHASHMGGIGIPCLLIYVSWLTVIETCRLKRRYNNNIKLYIYKIIKKAESGPIILKAPHWQERMA